MRSRNSVYFVVRFTLSYERNWGTWQENSIGAYSESLLVAQPSHIWWEYKTYIQGIIHELCAIETSCLHSLKGQYPYNWIYPHPGLAGFFHLVEETGLNPGLNHPGRNRFLPPEVEETGQNWKKAWNAWLSEYFPLQEAVILNTYETTAKNVLDTNTLLLFTCSFHGKWNKKLWWLPGRNKFFPLEVEETVIKNFI